MCKSEEIKGTKISEEEEPVVPAISMKVQSYCLHCSVPEVSLCYNINIQREKAEDGKSLAFYDHFACLRTLFDKYQSPWSPFDRADGGCRHIAAALFDLEASVRFNDLQSCTSGQCMWEKKGKRIEGSLPIQDLQTSSGGYGVTVKDSAKPKDFNPLCIPRVPAEFRTTVQS